MMKVITYATKKDEYYDSLVDSCKKYNYDLVTLGLGQPWNGMGDKIKGVNQYLTTIHEDETVIVADAYDVIACRDSKYLMSEYQKKFDTSKIIFNAECLPASYLLSWIWESRYSAKRMGKTKYNKLNAGVLISKVKILKDFYDTLIQENNLETTHITSDQELIYNMIDKDEKNIALDENCTLFNTIALVDDIVIEKGKLYNSHTDTYPFFIHGPGKKTKMEKYINAAGVDLNYTKPDSFDVNVINKKISIDIIICIALLFGLYFIYKTYM